MKMSDKTYFIKGAIEPDFIAGQIAGHGKKTNIGAHSIFLGQVREDKLDSKKVKAIEYSAYEEMANKEIAKIREDAFAKWELTCLHIYHSIGLVKTGEISLFVFVSSVHRKECQAAMQKIVEDIKNQVPVWKKEILEDSSINWVDK
ncbi:MAG: molybdenum cofactor biosynthesis protein MoaE [Calditrichaeota bacterium]|nr:MAG: molybdenum cofactor biosynthesis protein MoaE [Calditrichota bacterium]MBL1205719.1 molybdenum cofactor biosynthesis protein MoaE [Calditrichota bacterium]NOG45547.1 molybdenum cofactor biosynthesis protein MoaE [Calditrichota bacterium]